MTNKYLPVFLYRWDDANHKHNGSTVAYGEQRQVVSHYPSTIIGVATRPKGTTIEHMDSTPDYEMDLFKEWKEHVEEVSKSVIWFDEPMECDPENEHNGLMNND